MKYCPQCQTNYDDDSYEFCLQDGTTLAEFSNSQTPTVFLSEEQTRLKIKPTEQVQFFPPTEAQDWQASQVTKISPQVSGQIPPFEQMPPQPPKSNTVSAVLLTIIGMLALFGAGFGAWYFLGNRQTETNKNQNAVSPNSYGSPSPRNSSNTNVNTNKSTPTPSPTIDAAKVKSEVSGTIYDWKEATEAGDIDECMSFYADSINFYGSQKSRNSVRNDKQNAFNKYDSMEISLSNMNITLDASGEKATAVFDKEWTFIGEKVYSGKVQSQFQLIKSGGRWLITGEKDLKIYYVNK